MKQLLNGRGRVLHCSWKYCIFALIIQLLKKEKSSDQTGSFEVFWMKLELKQKLINICHQNYSHKLSIHATLNSHIVWLQTYRNLFSSISNSHSSRKRNNTNLLKWMPCSRISFYPCRKIIHFFSDHCNLVYVPVVRLW